MTAKSITAAIAAALRSPSAAAAPALAAGADHLVRNEQLRLTRRAATPT